MSQEPKQVPLNGAYYGPPIPPPNQSHQTHQTTNKWRSTFLTFITIITTIVIILGLATLIFWLIVRPTTVKFYAESASLTQFNLANDTNTLNYNLTLTIVTRNPNRRIGIYYDWLEATAYYEDERFGWHSVPRFYQGHKNTTELRIEFKGQRLLKLGAAEISRYNWEKSMGLFYVDVRLYAGVRFKVGAIKTKRYKPEIECNLRIPLASANGAGFVRAFEGRRCDVDV